MPDELAESFGGAPGEPDEPDLAAVEWLLPMATSWGRGGDPISGPRSEMSRE